MADMRHTSIIINLQVWSNVTIFFILGRSSLPAVTQYPRVAEAPISSARYFLRSPRLRRRGTNYELRSRGYAARIDSGRLRSLVKARVGAQLTPILDDLRRREWIPRDVFRHRARTSTSAGKLENRARARAFATRRAS